MISFKSKYYFIFFLASTVLLAISISALDRNLLEKAKSPTDLFFELRESLCFGLLAIVFILGYFNKKNKEE